MQPKCMPGDLAVIVWAHNDVNIGKIVKVLALHPNQREIIAPATDVLWTCQAAHLLTYDVGGKKRRRRKGPVPDSSLWPIRGTAVGHDIAMFVELHILREKAASKAAEDRVDSFV